MAAASPAPEASVARWPPAGPQRLGALAERLGPAGIAARLLQRATGRLPLAATQEEAAVPAKPPQVTQNWANAAADGMLRQAKPWGCALRLPNGPHESSCNSQPSPSN